MINRQRALIRLIDNEGGQIKMLRLVKLLFLLRETAEAVPKSGLYEFIPYHYGPYSFTLIHELRAIERDGWVRMTDHEVVLLRSGKKEYPRVDRALLEEVDSLTRRFKNVTTGNLVSRVYAANPWYTARAIDESRRGAVIPIAPLSVFTVGYEGLMVDGLLDLLLQTGVKSLIDVRFNPIARRFGFHKSAMERHCRDVDIRYTHVPELGIPSNKRSNLGDVRSYDRLFDYYEDKILAANSESLKTVSSLMLDEPSALMCMEADARYCHRSKLAEAIAKATNLPIKELRHS